MKNYCIFVTGTSPFSFINPLQVEAATVRCFDIGTVLKTFVLFLCFHKWTCFFELKRICIVINPSFSFVVVQINNFYKFYLECLKKASFLANHISFDSPKERVSKLASMLQNVFARKRPTLFLSISDF